MANFLRYPDFVPDSTAARLLSLLENVAWAKRRCRHCDAQVYLVRTNGGHNVAFTTEGIGSTSPTARGTFSLRQGRRNGYSARRPGLQPTRSNPDG